MAGNSNAQWNASQRRGHVPVVAIAVLAALLWTGIIAMIWLIFE